MFAQERRQSIIEILDQRGRLEFHELLAILKISPATLRRDLTLLEDTDRLVRVHGGILRRGALSDETPFSQRARTAVAAKQAIAKSAVRRIPAGATVFIDSGSTCLEAGRLLRSREDLTIITNSLPLLAGADQFRARLLVLGGEMRPVSSALVGDLALASLGRMRADIALIGASSLHPTDGVGTTELLETAIKREWLKRGRRCLLLADATKWDESLIVRFAEWNEFDELHTDHQPPKKFRPRTVKLVIAA